VRAATYSGGEIGVAGVPADLAGRAGDAGADAGLGDYLRLLKPRVMSLVVFTALAAIVAAPGGLHPVVALASLICIAAGAGAAGALNMWYDADIDRRMARTALRPIPAGRVEPDEALGLGLGLGLLSVAMLAVIANLLAAALLAFTIFFYAVVYTMLLKRSTPQNIVIGGAAGAFPPMIGWAAVTGGLGWAPVLMFAVIFLWTPPHFWALALYRNGDYARAKVPMMPVVAGEARTRRQVLLYTLALSAVAVLPAFTIAGGPVYLAVALAAGAVFLRCAWTVARRKAAQARADRYAAEKRLFGLSILYLFVVFGGFMAQALADRLAGPSAWPVWF
jgi:protoheme IX farnesyltransferase